MRSLYGILGLCPQYPEGTVISTALALSSSATRWLSAASSYCPRHREQLQTRRDVFRGANSVDCRRLRLKVIGR
jgi:hypothetical protein